MNQLKDVPPEQLKQMHEFYKNEQLNWMQEQQDKQQELERAQVVVLTLIRQTARCQFYITNLQSQINTLEEAMPELKPDNSKLN